MSKTETEIAQTVAEATAALDFTPLAAGDRRWVDFAPGRGEDAMVHLRRMLERNVPGRFRRVAFVSHRGAGKTTELNRLMAALEGRYRCLYLQANTELDANRFTVEDLLLVLARELEKLAREELAEPISPKLLGSIENWFATQVVSHAVGQEYVGEVRTEAKAEGGIPFFARLMGKVTALCKTESTHREKVENELRKYPGTLTESVNGLLDAVGKTLAKAGKELLVVIDNLDRYNPEVVDGLLVENADRLKELRVHLVVTPPISLVYRPISQSIDALFATTFLPTVRLRSQGDSYDTVGEPGKSVLLSALGKRIDLEVLLPDKAARDRLLFASGGAIRELLQLAQEATLEVDEGPLGLAVVDRVLQKRRQRLRDRVDTNGWWDTVVHIAKTKRLDRDPACQQLLYQRLVFQYNGEGWYDIHPLLSEVPEFQSLLKRTT